MWHAAAPLRTRGYLVRWVGAGLIHLTVKFLGEVDESRMDEIVALSVRAGIIHTPTLVMWEQLSHFMEPAWRQRTEFRFLPRSFRQVAWTPEYSPANMRDLTAEDLEALRRALPKMRELTFRLFQAGARLHAGSDVIMPFVVPGLGLQQELVQLVEAGLTPERAWLVATRWPGEWLGEPGLGTLREGAPADVVFFREDPTRDLRALSTLEAVIADGRFYSRPWLDQAVTEQRAHFEGALYDSISTWAARWIVEGLTD